MYDTNEAYWPLTHAYPVTDFFSGYNCQRQAHTYYPVNLYLNENRILLGNDTVPPHIRLSEDDDPMDAASYSQFELTSYAPDVILQGWKFPGTSRPYQQNRIFYGSGTLVTMSICVLVKRNRA